MSKPVIELSPEALAEIETIIARYPEARSAILPVMHVIQREHGHIPEAARPWVAERLGMSRVKVEEVLSFYTMLRTRPVGGKHLQVCRSLSCTLRGGEAVARAVRDRLGIAPGETTADGKFSLVHVECLGSCDTAPVMQVNDENHECLTRERVAALLEEWSR